MHLSVVTINLRHMSTIGRGLLHHYGRYKISSWAVISHETYRDSVQLLYCFTITTKLQATTIIATETDMEAHQKGIAVAN